MAENMREVGMKAEVYIKEEISPSSSFEQTLSEYEPGEYNIEITEIKGNVICNLYVSYNWPNG